MKFRQVAQRITELDRAVNFYNRILNQQPIAVFDPPGFAFYNLEGVRLFLDVNAPSSLLYLEVADVRETIEELRAEGFEISTEPHVVFPDEGGVFDVPGDEWLAFVTDSEGNQLGLMSRN
ncbi:MAG: VOC family protein [Micrococcales bacterium]